jgi:hypothetical protein
MLNPLHLPRSSVNAEERISTCLAQLIRLRSVWIAVSACVADPFVSRVRPRPCVPRNHKAETCGSRASASRMRRQPSLIHLSALALNISEPMIFGLTAQDRVDIAERLTKAYPAITVTAESSPVISGDKDPVIFRISPSGSNHPTAGKGSCC